MKYNKRKIIFLIVAILIIYLPFGAVVHAENNTEIYFIFQNNEKNAAYLELGTQQILYDNALDSMNLDNLEIMPLDVRIHYSFSTEDLDLQSLTNEVRKFLLQQGYARLVDSEIASKSELNYQQQAQKQKLGIWNSADTAPEPTSTPTPAPTGEDGNDSSEAEEKAVPEWLKAIVDFLVSNGLTILSILGGCGFLSFIVSVIIKKVRTRKKMIYLGGGNAAGKSTLLLYLLNPDASNADLLRQSPTLTLKKERIIRDDTNSNKKFTIQAALLDPPGHELEHAIDQLMLTWWKKRTKKNTIIIIVVALTKKNKLRNDIDQAYIDDQLQNISKFWSALLKAQKTITPESVVMFINKLDLYDDTSKIDGLFDRHKKVLENICKEARIPFYCISGSVLDKSGMTELMQIIKKRR